MSDLLDGLYPVDVNPVPWVEDDDDADVRIQVSPLRP